MPAPSYDTTDLLPTNTMSGVGNGTGLDPFWPVDLADALGLKYIFQQGTTPRVFDGTTMSKISGTAPGTFSISATTASGAGFTAKTFYSVVYFDPNHEEYCTTGPYADLTSVEIFPSASPVAQDVNCTISDPPATEPRLIRARVFRALNETADLRQLTGTGTYSDVTVSPGSGGTHLFTDTGAVTEDELATRDTLNLRKRYFTDGLPPSSHTGCFYQGRLWMVDPANGNLLYSEPNLPEDFPTDNFVQLQAGEGDPNPWTVAIRVNNNQLMAYTERGCYLILGSGPPFSVRALYRGVGPISTQATLYADSAGIIFPSQDAIYVHPGGSEVTRLGAPPKWPGMNPIDDLYEAVDKGRGENMVAILDRDRTLYTLGCALADGDGVNTGGFEWGYVRSDWAYLTNRYMSAAGLWSNVQGRLWPVFGDEFGNIWQAELGDSEGAYPTTGTNVVTTVSAVVAPGNAFNTNNTMATDASILGLPVVVRDPVTGSLSFANRVLSVTSSVVTFLYNKPGSILTGYIIELGPIFGIWESGWWSPSRDFAKCHLNYLYPLYPIQADGGIRVFIGIDQGSSLQPYNNPSYAGAGFFDQNFSPVYQTFDKIPMNAWVNQMKVRFEGSGPGNPWGLYGCDAEVTVKRHRR